MLPHDPSLASSYFWSRSGEVVAHKVCEKLNSIFGEHLNLFIAPFVFTQVLRPFLLRRKKDEVEKYLPVKTQVILKCDMSAWQKAYYEQVTSRERVALGSGMPL